MKWKKHSQAKGNRLWQGIAVYFAQCELGPIIGLLSFVSIATATAADLQVTFQVGVPDLPKDATVFITGNVSSLGNWNPSRVPMQKGENNIWTHEITLSEPQKLEYKYTLGSWKREGADAKGNPLKNLTLHVKKSHVRKDTVHAWTKKREHAFSGKVTGDVRYHRQLKGEEIAKRDVVIWLPPDYESSKNRYPVLYMHDGQNLFDPKTSAFGVDWQIDETCTRLIKEGAIEPLIVVGIDNTPARTLEYTTGSKGDAYRRFVVEVVKPLIDKTYRTQPGRESTFVGGSSAGGLCAFILAWEYSHIFSKTICMSPAFQFEGSSEGQKLDYVTEVEKVDRPKEKLFFYLDNGGVGLEQKLQPGIDAMIAALRAKGYKQGKDFRWNHTPEAPHNEAAWGRRFPEAIQSLNTKPVKRSTHQ